MFLYRMESKQGSQSAASADFSESIFSGSPGSPHARRPPKLLNIRPCYWRFHRPLKLAVPALPRREVPCTTDSQCITCSDGSAKIDRPAGRKKRETFCLTEVLW